MFEKYKCTNVKCSNIKSGSKGEFCPDCGSPLKKVDASKAVGIKASKRVYQKDPNKLPRKVVDPEGYAKTIKKLEEKRGPEWPEDVLFSDQMSNSDLEKEINKEMFEVYRHKRDANFTKNLDIYALKTALKIR